MNNIILENGGLEALVDQLYKVLGNATRNSEQERSIAQALIKRINAPDNPHKGQPLNKYFTKKFQALKDSNKPLETVDQVVQLIFKEQTKISKNLASVSELAGRDVDVMQLLASKSKNDDKSDGEGRHKRKHEGPSANTKRFRNQSH